MLRWGTALAVICCLLGVAAASAKPVFPPAPPTTAPGHRRCGTLERFGHRFPVEAQGIGCGQARRLLARPCRTSVHKRWACTSFREGLPFETWFPTADLFGRRLYPAALLRRYPCSEAKVTPRLFALTTTGFPTRRQLLADDVLRCGLLKPGDTAAEVEALIGPPDSRENEGARKPWVYLLGLERDSIVQIDPELLDVEFDRGHLTSIEMVQGG